MKRLLPLTITLLVAILIQIGCTAKKQNHHKIVHIPRGWFLSNNNAGVKLLKAAENKTFYTLNFNRIPKNPDDYYYIEIAESIFPTQKKIRAATHVKLTNWYFERLWWSDEHNEYRIPFSITGDTIVYYIDQYKAFKEKYRGYTANQIWNQGVKERIKFNYTATVTRDFEMPRGFKNFSGKKEKPVKVTLHLLWYYYCGQPCGWGFEQTREVIFLSKDRVVRIHGDGKTRKWISTITEPYAPDQWITF